MKKRLSVALRIALGAAATGCVDGGSGAALAADPIKIGVIAEAQAIAGASIPQAAQLAADEINAKGGVDGRKIEIVTYDNHSSVGGFGARLPARGQRGQGQRGHRQLHQRGRAGAGALGRAAEDAVDHARRRLRRDHARASTRITSKNKYTFHGYLTSSRAGAARSATPPRTCWSTRCKMKTAVIMSEDAAWTKPLDVGYEECLPKIGLKVLDHIRFSPDTTDFTPIFNKIEGAKPDVIITGISHVGVQPTVQWKNQQVPIPMFGISSQATNSTFWKDTNGATEGVLYQGVSGPGVAVTPKTVPFADALQEEVRQLSRPMPATPPMTRSITSPTR